MALIVISREISTTTNHPVLYEHKTTTGVNPRSAVVLIENSGGYPTVRKSKRSPGDLRPVSQSLIRVESIGAISHAPNDRGLIAMENPGAK